MAKRISKEDCNEIKVAMAILYISQSGEVSYNLATNKAYLIGEKLLINDPEKLDRFADEVRMTIKKSSYEQVKKKVLRRLIEIEAYEEIIELGLNKIKL